MKHTWTGLLLIIFFDCKHYTPLKKQWRTNINVLVISSLKKNFRYTQPTWNNTKLKNAMTVTSYYNHIFAFGLFWTTTFNRVWTAFKQLIKFANKTVKIFLIQDNCYICMIRVWSITTWTLRSTSKWSVDCCISFHVYIVFHVAFCQVYSAVCNSVFWWSFFCRVSTE